MLNWNVSRDFARRTLALAAVFGTGVAVMGAQTHTTTTDDTPTVSATVHAQPALFSSSADESTAAPALDASLLPANPFGDPMQYGGGQRSRAGGRPRYRGGNTTADGTPKYTFEFGAGLAQPLGDTWHYLTPSYSIGGGFGRNFNKRVGLMFQVNYDHLGFTGQTLAAQSGLYFSGDTNPADNGLDGATHLWSFSLNPTYTLSRGDNGGLGSYLIAGVGLYHKVANFTTPQQQYYCDYYYGCGTVYANGTFDHYSSNAPGFSGGFGLTYKISRFANERFYMEARYVFVDNSARQGYVYSSTVGPPTYAAPSGPNADPNNYFPANSHHTTYVPIQFGIRF